MHYKFCFAFHAKANAPFALAEKQKFELIHQCIKYIQERKCNQGHFLIRTKTKFVN